MCINILSQGLFFDYYNFFRLKNAKNSGSQPQKSRLRKGTLPGHPKVGFFIQDSVS